jgi:hypothetical protein
MLGAFQRVLGMELRGEHLVEVVTDGRGFEKDPAADAQ